MKVYQVGYRFSESISMTTELRTNLKRSYKQLIFDRLRIEIPEFGKVYQDEAYVYQLHKTEKEAIKTFYVIVDGILQYTTVNIPRNFDEMCEKIFIITRRKYPELLI